MMMMVVCGELETKLLNILRQKNAPPTKSVAFLALATTTQCSSKPIKVAKIQALHIRSLAAFRMGMNCYREPAPVPEKKPSPSIGKE
jgi:hypothetical protein